MTAYNERGGKTLARFLIVALVAAVATRPAIGAPSWNRKVLGVAAVPGAAPDTHKITLYYSLTAGELAIPIDVSTEAEIAVNGDVVQLSVQTATAFPHADPECAGLSCFSKPCLCTGMPPTCRCVPVRLSVVATVPLLPGDEVTATLRPAAGAAAETYGADDVQSIAFDGSPVFWERVLENVAITPAGTSFTYDVSFDVTYLVNDEGFLDLSTNALVEVNGTPAGGAVLGLNDQQFLFCAGDCLLCWAFGSCGPGGDPCMCKGTIGLTVNAMPATPGDEIAVRLEVPPGALPPLDGYGGEMEATFTICPGDCGDGDWNVGVIDLLALIGQWGQSGGTCDLELGAEGVGVDELLMLLTTWGSCRPPSITAK